MYNNYQHFFKSDIENDRIYKKKPVLLKAQGPTKSARHLEERSRWHDITRSIASRTGPCTNTTKLDKWIIIMYSYGIHIYILTT